MSTPIEPDAAIVTSEPTKPESAGRGNVQMTALQVALFIAIAVIVNTFGGAFTGVKGSDLLHAVLNLNSTQMSTFALIAGIPAYIRPFMGTGADLFPLFGFHRKSYYVLSWLTVAAGLLAMAYIPSHGHYSYWPVVWLSILSGLGGNLLFVIIDSIMVSVGNQTGSIGTLQAIQQGLPLVLGLSITSYLGGYVAQHWSFQNCYLASGLICAVSALSVLFINETPVDRRYEKRPRTLSEQHYEKLQDKADTAKHAKTLGNALMSPGLWIALIYVFYLILTPGPGSAQYVYFHDILHFNLLFIGKLGIPANAGAIIGTGLFLLVGKKVPTVVVVWGAFFGDLSSYPLLYLYHSHMSAIIITFVSSISGQIYNLCLLTFAAKVTPKGVEASIYALFVSIITFAGNISNLMGAFMYDYFGPAHHHTVQYGWNMSATIGMCFTLASCILIPFLPRWTRDAKYEREQEALRAATIASAES